MQNNEKQFNVFDAFRSSSNPEKVSMTFRGVLLMFVPMILIIAQSVGVPLTEMEVIDFINTVTAGLAVVLIGFGLLRKVWNTLKAWAQQARKNADQ